MTETPLTKLAFQMQLLSNLTKAAAVVVIAVQQYREYKKANSQKFGFYKDDDFK